MYEDLEKLEEKFNLTDFPLNIIVEPSNRCNLNCIMCMNDKLTRPRGIMDITLYKRIIDEIAIENPYTRLWLDYYGEPLLQRYKIYYFIDYAKKRGLKNVCINTNGTLLNEEMAEMLFDSGIDFISIDCDGFSKEVFEKIRVNSNRDNFYKNIDYFLKRKKELSNIVKKLPIVELKITEMPENLHEIDLVMNYWKGKGAWTAKRRLISWGGKIENVNFVNKKERIACGSAMGILPITWDGQVTNCVMDVDAKFVCGNVKNESIKSIWKRRNIELLQKHLNHEWGKLPVICQNCEDWKIVGEERYDELGNPVIKNYDENSSMLQSDLQKDN